MFLHKALYLEVRVAHLDSESFRFIATRYGTAVIVGKHNDRLALQVWSEHPFAGGKEVVAVGKGEHEITSS